MLKHMAAKKIQPWLGQTISWLLSQPMLFPSWTTFPRFYRTTCSVMQIAFRLWQRSWGNSESIWKQLKNVWRNRVPLLINLPEKQKRRKKRRRKEWRNSAIMILRKTRRLTALGWLEGPSFGSYMHININMVIQRYLQCLFSIADPPADG